MKQYIVNLTNYLISKNRYDEIFQEIRNSEEFVRHIATNLKAGDVRTMSPDKLGEIMCSFEVSEIIAAKDDIFNSICFSGDCERMLRGLVSICLAYTIKDRLSDERLPSIPKWERQTPAWQKQVKKVADDLVRRRRAATY